MESILFPTFFSTGTLLASIFSIYIAVLFFRIPNRSAASFHFAMVSFYIFLLNLSYMFSSAVYHPYLAHHKTIALLAAIFGGIHGAQMILNFPQKQNSFFTKQLPVIQYIVAILALIAFSIYAVGAEKKFTFSGHYWDYNIGLPYQLMSLLILLYFFIGYIAGIVKTFFARGQTRAMIALLTLSYFIFTFFPGILNSLSRYGIVGRETYMINVVIMNLLGFFFTSLIFINTLRERSSIMHKIVSISMLTMLIIIQAFSYFWISDQDKAYDEIKIHQAGGEGTDSRYTYDFNSDTGQFQFSHDALNTSINPQEREYLEKQMRHQLYGIFIFEKLATLSQADQSDPQKNNAREQILTALDKSPKSFLLLKLLIQNKISASSPEETFDFISQFNDKLFKYREQLFSLPQKSFSQDFTQFLKDLNLPVSVEKEMSDYIKRQVDDSEVREFALASFAPIGKVNSRLYRGIQHYPASIKGNPNTLFLSYVEQNGNFYRETGYSYKDYRKFIARSSTLLTIIIISVSLAILFIFRYFFLGAIIRPLEKVINGLKMVNSGNLEIRVRIEVEDEIGFLARSFNQMTRSILVAQKELVQYAETLEDKVDERTKELHETLNSVQKLKTQQDGDYFLTTQLIQPLTQNHIESSFHEIDFCIRQKKKFEFKKWAREIGGDYCLATTLTLQNKVYHLVTNADAMGKSIQGAGGALVLGSVLHSIIERTYLSPHEQRRSPERWLKNTFVELHRVFESFDGSMLISLVIGLVDDETGLLYYLNAEHPLTLLYRDEKASFMETGEYLFRKLGTPDVKSILSVSTFQMMENDVILMGSDGRDDFYLVTEDGQEAINEDETHILSVIEKEKGNPEEIYNFLNHHFVLIDDFSMLRIKRLKASPLEQSIPTPDNLTEVLHSAAEMRKKENFKEALKTLAKLEPLSFTEYPGFYLDVLREKVRIFAGLKDYESVQETATEILEKNPGNSEMLYILSYAARKNKDLETAVSSGERLRLRLPGHIKNLVNLSECHLKQKNAPRAKRLYEEAYSIDDSHPNLKKIAAAFEKLESKTSGN